MVTQTSIGRRQSGNNADAWLSPSAAASIRRVDNELGYTLPVTWAGRSASEQYALVKKYYRRTLFGGEFFYDGSWWKKKPGSKVVVAKPRTSPHESGNAADTDEYTRPGFVALMARHGWIRPLSSEKWHFVHSDSRDQHLNDPTTGGNTTTTTDDNTITIQEAMMATSPIIVSFTSDDHRNGLVLAAPRHWHKMSAEEYAATAGLEPVKSAPIVEPPNARAYDLLKAVLTRSDVE